MSDDFEDDIPSVPTAAANPDAAAPGLPDALPSWYREIFPAGPRDGLYEKIGEHALVFVDRGSDTLVVTFDNLADAGYPGYDAEVWAGKFIRDHGWNHLGVLSQGATWFRDARLMRRLDQLRDDGLFARHAHVTMAGASMGGYAAMAFADLAPGCNVLAFSPQATLDRAYVPWEHRFLKGQARDWRLPRAHAGDHVADVANLWVVYDPFLTNDVRHIDLLPARKVRHLRAIGQGHKTALVMKRMGWLKEIMQRAVEDRLDERWFYQATRNRKDIYVYRKAMEEHLHARGKAHRIDMLIAAFRARKARKAKEQAAAAANPAP